MEVIRPTPATSTSQGGHVVLVPEELKWTVMRFALISYCGLDVVSSCGGEAVDPESRRCKTSSIIT